MTQHAEVRWTHGMTFLARGGTNHWITMDAKPEVGGCDAAPRPIELLLFALGGCTSMDVVAVLKKKKQDVREFRVELIGEQRPDNPHAYTDIVLHFHVTGEGIEAVAVKRAIELSRDTYCSVGATLKPGVNMSYRFTIHHSGGEETYDV